MPLYIKKPHHEKKREKLMRIFGPKGRPKYKPVRYKKVVKNIIALRKKRGLRAVDICTVLQCSEQYYGKIETNVMLPSLDVLLQLCQFYKVDLAKILA